MQSDDRPTRQEVAKALRILEQWGRLGVETRAAPKVPERRKDDAGQSGTGGEAKRA